MTRRTIKYRQAVLVAKRLTGDKLYGVPLEYDQLYSWLSSRGWCWNADFQVFSQQPQISKSVFISDQGDDSGEFRVRVRAAPRTAAALTLLLEDLLPLHGYRVSDVSNQEKDTSGASVRVYIQGKATKRKVGRK